MAVTDVHVKVITEVKPKAETFSIHCFSDMKASGETTPTLFKSQILQEPTIVDNVEGKEGELILSFDRGKAVGELKEGTLTISPEEDDAQKYSRGGIDNADLIYTE